MQSRRVASFLAMAGLLGGAACGPSGTDREQALREKALDLQAQELRLREKALDLRERELRQARQDPEPDPGSVQSPAEPVAAAPAVAPALPFPDAPALSAMPETSPVVTTPSTAALPSAEALEMQRRTLETQEQLLRQLQALQDPSAAPGTGAAATPYSSPAQPFGSASPASTPATRQNAQSSDMQKMLNDLKNRSGR
jgi:hypothetical protein